MTNFFQRLGFFAMHRLLGLLSLVLAWGLSPAAFAQTPAVECRWADGAIAIDGKADEVAWQGAEVVTNFAMPWLGKGEKGVSSSTRARLLWDREYLYFLAEMEDADLAAYEAKQAASTWEEDTWDLFLKPLREKGGYYQVQVNPGNVQRGTFLAAGESAKPSGTKEEVPFESAVSLHGTLNQAQDKDEGWRVEGRVAWRNLLRTGGRPNPEETWSFALCRCDYGASEPMPVLTTSAPLKRLDFHRFEDYAALKFVGPPAKAAKPYGIGQRVFWTNSQVVGSPNPPFAYQTAKAFPKLPVHLPVAIASEPGSDRLIFIEHTQPWGGHGKVRRFVNDPNVTNAVTLLESEDILYGLTFHPRFQENGYLYVGGNGPWNKSGKKTRVVRYTMSRQPPYEIEPKSRLVVIEWDSDGHNGGDMVFGKDGMLYVTSGDGTSDSDRDVVGQDLTKLTAKVLRIDVDKPSEGKGYSVPAGNPFMDVPGARPETWAYGLRNPWRITVDRESGRIWVGENGQDLWEIVRVIERGANYGWSVYEGSHPFHPTRKMGPHPLTPPTIELPHSEFRSLSGGVVYHGRKLRDLRGVYIYGDWSTGRIWGAKHNGERLEWNKELVDTPFAITGFGVDAEGELLVIDEGSGFYRLEPAAPQSRTNRFPTKLSETGVFASVKEHKVDPALIPYSVNAPLWSDGAEKERFIGLPGNEQIEFTHNRAWNFPEGTVLVKTFALDLEEGNPGSRRRIETRLLTKQQKEWVGYTYRWNDEQTEAQLVEAAGADEVFEIKSAQTPGGVRRQTWHYPSRTECMVCHSRAANFLLGLTELQMNRTHTYPNGVEDNQLRVLEHLGVLKVDWVDYEREATKREKPPTKIKDPLPGQRQPVASSLLPRAPERMRTMPDPMDTKQPLEARAKAYLQGNCAHCHVEAGGGNALMELEYLTPLQSMRIWDAKPQHHTFELPEARLVAPGYPERSVLLHRVSHRGAGHMPPLGTSLVDEEAVKMLREWIGGRGEMK